MRVEEPTHSVKLSRVGWLKDLAICLLFCFISLCIGKKWVTSAGAGRCVALRIATGWGASFFFGSFSFLCFFIIF